MTEVSSTRLYLGNLPRNGTQSLIISIVPSGSPSDLGPKPYRLKSEFATLALYGYGIYLLGVEDH